MSFAKQLDVMQSMRQLVTQDLQGISAAIHQDACPVCQQAGSFILK